MMVVVRLENWEGGWKVEMKGISEKVFPQSPPRTSYYSASAISARAESDRVIIREGNNQEVKAGIIINS